MQAELGLANDEIHHSAVVFALARGALSNMALDRVAAMRSANLDMKALSLSASVSAGLAGQTLEAHLFALVSCFHYQNPVVDCPPVSDLENAHKFLLMALAKGTASSKSVDAVVAACTQNEDVVAAEAAMLCALELGVAAGASSFSSLIKACATAGDAARGEHWLDKARSFGLIQQVSSDACNLTVHAWVAVGEPECAAACLSALLADMVCVSSSCVGEVITALAKGGSCKQAEAWLKKAQDAHINLSPAIYAFVIEAFVVCGNLSEAEMWLHQTTQEGCACARSYEVIIAALFSAGHVQQAERLLTQACENGMSSMRLLGLHRKLLRNYESDAAAANRVLWTIIRDQMANGIKADVSDFNVVLNACAMEGDTERGTSVMEKMGVLGVVPDSVACAAIAKLSLNYKEVVDALHGAMVGNTGVPATLGTKVAAT
eukprot:gnl/MRDRNA2_/MRDRNA2_129320_c0_seq1.p1 gnl/MRDRNA2_/MRDRNA2_129320_c0~~gnl/MRDRNA2_/MRDRNA2_129320_c0_seq1.p1  ORF type:complete len:482 (+),score=105.47 gnl/MRDRNA2_/MRDRNA2_129320_c0_seq1:150-1448(+)